MSSRMMAVLLLVSAVTLLPCGCSASRNVTIEEHAVPGAAGSVSSQDAGEGHPALQEMSAAIRESKDAGRGFDVAEEAEPAALATPLPEALGSGSGLGRKIIKTGSITIEVKDLRQALTRLETTAVELGGYVLETTTYGEESDRSGATVRFAIPADRFETAMRRVRELATRLIAEQVSGLDVTEEYVDLQSEIANLEVTQARLRALMEEARTVEEALAVNSQLMTIEGEIAQRKGRLQYLAQRSAFSTISVELIGPRPQPTVTPTPTPVPEWQPGPIVDESRSILRVLLQGLATILIRMLIVLLPLAILIGAPLGIAWWLVKRWRDRSRSR